MDIYICKIIHNKETISPLEFCTPAWSTLIKTKENNTRQILTLLLIFLFYKNNFYALTIVYSKDIVFKSSQFLVKIIIKD